MAVKEDVELMGRVARLYYLQGLTRVEIAQRLGISRFKAGRLLDAAVEAGPGPLTLNPRSLLLPQISGGPSAGCTTRQGYSRRADRAPRGGAHPPPHTGLRRGAP